MNVKKKVPYSGKGIIQDVIKGPKALYDYFWSLTEDADFDPDPDTNDKIRQSAHHFIVHTYASMKARYAKKDDEQFNDNDQLDDLFVPIYCRLIDKKMGRIFQVLEIRDKDLIKMKPANSAKHISRRYSLQSEIWETAAKIVSNETSEKWMALTEGKFKKFVPFNIVNGERIRTVVTNNYQPKEQTFKTPVLVKTAMEVISPCVFNPKYVGWWVDYLEIAYLKKKEEFERSKSAGDLDEEEIDGLENALDRLEKKYKNERFSQETILYQQPVLIEETSEKGALLYEYRAAYKPQVSGRLTEIGGGMQNASRVFKYLAFKDVKKYYNYDLKASQANILIHELKRCGVDASWITGYIKDPDAKYTYAELIGTDSETWKKCLYATFMGADPSKSDSSIQNTLIEHFDDEKLADQAIKKFKTVAKGLLSSTRKWRKIIISHTDSPYIYYSKTKENHRHWKNACKMRYKRFGITRKDNYVDMETLEEDKTSENYGKLKILNNKEKSEMKRKLAAFILQGQEACFIHNLTILCNSNGIKVMRNEHDGIITDLSIPDSLIKEAGSEAKLKGARLEEKPLASKEDIKKASILIGKMIR